MVAAVLLMALPRLITHEFYINMASQCLIFAILALSLNLMLGFGGMASLGHAAYIGVAGYTCILLTVAGYIRCIAAIAALILSTVAPACSECCRCEPRARLPDDHAGARPDRLGHRLSREHVDRWR